MAGILNGRDKEKTYQVKKSSYESKIVLIFFLSVQHTWTLSEKNVFPSNFMEQPGTTRTSFSSRNRI